ncbi:hypothetical protein KKF92_03160 [Patescibacteria group bacterium]|nr:hypothetical protein [Patescibacteria group bacterium]
MSNEQRKVGDSKVGNVEFDRKKILFSAQDAASAIGGRGDILYGFTILEKDRGLIRSEEVVSLQESLQTLNQYLERIKNAFDLGFTGEQIDSKAKELRQLRKDAVVSFEGES